MPASLHKKFAFPRLFLVILLVLMIAVLASPAFAILQTGSIKIFAVTEDHKGMAAELLMYTIPGTGKAAFITSNSLVGKDTQTTGNIALQLAQKATGVKLTDKDFIFDIRANASEVDGPSAGAAMALLSYSMFSEKPLQPGVAVTGTINTDGSIGMVGGVGPKAQAAAKAGIKLFMIPTGEAITEVDKDGNGFLDTVNLLEFGPKELGMKVVEVSTLDAAISYAYSNVEEIKIDTNTTSTIFIPKSITYNHTLEPMKKISQNYIDNAKSVITEATTELEKSTMPDDLRANLNQRLAATKRSVEMAQRFLDQNYLYSSANYAFTSRVTAGTVREIAENPSLLSNDSTILASKVSSLRNDINSFKEQMNFIPLNGFEWIIGAQQRVAYAEIALDKIDTSMTAIVDAPGATPADQKTAEQELLYDRVYEYASADAWVGVSKDFLKEAQKDTSKYSIFYTDKFTKDVFAKITSTENLIKDSNVSQESIDEATRRLNAAKKSFDDNFLLAAIYDSYFADAFVSSENSRLLVAPAALLQTVGTDINEGLGSDSIWANMFFDHAKFYYENAVFTKKLARTEEVNQSIETSYDMIFLSNKIVQAKAIISTYLGETKLPIYSDKEATVGVTYTTTTMGPLTESQKYTFVLIMILVILVLVFILLMGLVTKSHANQLTHSNRKEKISSVLGNLDRALGQKKISDAEYFFMKKHYEQELSSGKAWPKKKRMGLTMEDLRAKQRALERGLVDLRRHFKAGLILPEDYRKSHTDVQKELEDIRAELYASRKENRIKPAKAKKPSAFSSITARLFKKREAPLKGTAELAEIEKRSEARERNKRRKLINNFTYKGKK
ncbi:Archaeal Lon protease [uncultured archaeon]|nr:Archaeal Lon protease [uncultured archaeon]